MCYRFLIILLISFSVRAGCHESSCLIPIQSKEPELFIFVSFSMPEQSLKLWAEQANLLGGKLLLRGFYDNSLEKTTVKTLELFGQNPNVEIAIDPERFQQFNIQGVPAVVIAQPEPSLEQNDLPPALDVVYGDTSLEEALKRIVESGAPESQKMAQSLLKQVEKAYE